MPDYPSWIERVPHIRATLEAPTAPPFLDRAAIEQLFGLRRRQAIALLGRCGGYQLGRTFLVSRESLLAFVREPSRATLQHQVQARRQRVREALEETGEPAARARGQQPIPVAPRSLPYRADALPAGVQLMPGQLTLRFATAEQLLSQLYEVAQILLHDYEEMMNRGQPPGGGPGEAAPTGLLTRL